MMERLDPDLQLALAILLGAVLFVLVVAAIATAVHT